MLMPGRYVSDTSERCMTISRTGWSTILVDSCKPLGVLYANNFSSGGATAAYANNNLILSVPEGGSIGFAMEVAAGVDNTFEFNVGNISGASEQGVLVTVLETIDNVQYVIGGGSLLPGRQKVNFRSVANSVSLVFPEHFTEMELAMICTKYPKSVQHTYLVDVCDESKDRYRFGVNGQEKVNEIAGVGNHNTAQFWEYDTRVARRWNLDPVDQVGISNYAANYLNPILFNDPDGDNPLLYYALRYVTVEVLAATAVTLTVGAAWQISKNYGSYNHINSGIDNTSYRPALPSTFNPAKTGSTKVEKSDFQKIQDKRGDAQSRVSKTPQKARQASTNSGNTKSKAAPVRPKAAPTSVPKPQIRLAEQNEEPKPQEIKLSPEKSGQYFPKRDLPRDPKSGSPSPDSEYPHTQLGTNEGRKGEYPQSREWDYDKNGNIELKRDIDWTDHGRPGNHDSPHQHDWEENSTGGTKKHGPAKPVEIPKQ